ncbi:MAG: carboxypeptidase regulatory-like domain-containing protein, partial [Anaerolineae bacterium]|nr:carboxypeptidase regulatory-like domain-containing protein [Anaerolineae bacterium]
MSGEYFAILGRITDHQSGNNLVGLRVEAWDKEQIFTTLLGSATTGIEGDYQLAFQVSTLEEVFSGRRGELLLNVLDGSGQLIHSTEVWLPEDIQPGEMTVDISIDGLSASEDNSSDDACTVHGRILQPDGRPAVGFTVKAFDKDLHQELLLGEATTGEDGSYSIAYSASQFSRPDKTQADLVVRAYGLDGEESAASPIILGAPADQLVELVVGNQAYRGPSEYEQLKTLVEPLLGDTAISELDEQDVAYLAAKTGLDPLHVAYYIKSTRLEAQSTIDAEVFWLNAELWGKVSHSRIPRGLVNGNCQSYE